MALPWQQPTTTKWASPWKLVRKKGFKRLMYMGD